MRDIQIQRTGLQMFNMSVARAAMQSEFGAGVEDMTSLCGPPTPHHTMHIVLRAGDRQLKVVALRDSGAADTIMSAMLYRQLTDLPLK